MKYILIIHGEVQDVPVRASDNLDDLKSWIKNADIHSTAEYAQAIKQLEGDHDQALMGASIADISSGRLNIVHNELFYQESDLELDNPEIF